MILVLFTMLSLIGIGVGFGSASPLIGGASSIALLISSALSWRMVKRTFRNQCAYMRHISIGVDKNPAGEKLVELIVDAIDLGVLPFETMKEAFSSEFSAAHRATIQSMLRDEIHYRLSCMGVLKRWNVSTAKGPRRKLIAWLMS
jgi:hypothetical protein